jgi:hypothetical protein
MKRLLYCLILITSFIFSSLTSANAVEYVNIVGKIVDYAGLPGRQVDLIATLNGNVINTASTKNETFTIRIPKNVKVKIDFTYYANFDKNYGFLTIANWNIYKEFSKDENLDFIIPKVMSIRGKVQTYSNSLFAYRAEVNFGAVGKSTIDPIDLNNNGELWNGGGAIGKAFVGIDGTFVIKAFMMTSEYANHRFTVVAMPDRDTVLYQNSIIYKVKSDDFLVFCLRNLDEGSLTKPDFCLKDSAEEEIDLQIAKQKAASDKAAAELKAKQEAEAKAAAELKAKQEAEAKAAAELKAKQEAEAKAAAELKAKQEAEAKAAAELKARQEAEAKAAAELKAKQEADAKVTSELKALAELKAKQEAEANRKEQTISVLPLTSGQVQINPSGIRVKVSTTSNLSVFAYNSTNSVCEFLNGIIRTKIQGRCVIAFSQEGNSDYKPASNLVLDFTIVSAATKKTTITCVKGKLTKKVTAIKPKCPTGYKLKK